MCMPIHDVTMCMPVHNVTMCMPIHNVTTNKICKKCDIKIVSALRGCRLLVPFVKTFDLFSFVVHRECGFVYEMVCDNILGIYIYIYIKL